MRPKSFYGSKRSCALCIIALIYFGGCRHMQENLNSSLNALTDKEYAVAEKSKIVSDAYASILDKYIIPLEADQLIVNALEGMQNFVGKEGLSFAREESGGFAISSSGRTIKIKKVFDKKQGASQIRRIYSFVATANPQYSETGLAYAAIKKMVRMDDRSDLMPPEDYKQAQRETQGMAVGIGVEVRIEREGVRVRIVTTVEQSPADKAGILPGDQILMINGQATKELSRDEIYGLLRGQKDRDVTLTILRKGFSEPMIFTMTPEVITWKNIRYKLLDRQYAYISIARFGTKTAADFDEAIKEMNKVTTGKIKGLILDLRDSPGGILGEVLEIASRFVKSGIIISVEGKQGIWKMKRKEDSPILDFPTVVLVNSDTSAGAEIVAGVLQDYRRAIVVGTPTSRDVSIQTIIPLKDGSGLRVTTHVWRLPFGRSIQEKGIVPDFDIGTEDRSQETRRDVEKDKAVQIATQILKGGSLDGKDNLRRIAPQATGNNS